MLTGDTPSATLPGAIGVPGSRDAAAGSGSAVRRGGFMSARPIAEAGTQSPPASNAAWLDLRPARRRCWGNGGIGDSDAVRWYRFPGAAGARHRDLPAVEQARLSPLAQGPLSAGGAQDRPGRIARPVA